MVSVVLTSVIWSSDGGAMGLAAVKPHKGEK